MGRQRFGQSPGIERIDLPGGRSLDLTARPLVMGILNITPDSFYADSRLAGPRAAAERAAEMEAAGADLIDVGGESTRPGSHAVDEEEEIARVVPAIEAIRERTSLPLSVDTKKAMVARLAVAAGADIVNDVSALRSDDRMAETVVGLGVPAVLMHMRGTPETMQRHPHYEDVVREVCEELAGQVERLHALGMTRERIILDPGIGFGKRVADNLALLKGIPQLKRMGYPVLIGVSRKGFLGTLTGGRSVEERLPATMAANAYAALAGADILRVHDVAEAVDMKRVLIAIAAAD